MPSLSSIIGQASRGADLYFVFRFLRLLTMKYTSTSAYKLGIIDKKGKALKRSADLESVKEKAAYTMMHRMVFKIRGLIEKVPVIGKSVLLNYAAALFLLKEQKDARIWTDDGYMKSKLLEFLETDWEADAKFLKEEVDNMEKKSFTSFLSETKKLNESQELQAMMALDDAGIEAVIDKKGQIIVNKRDLKKAEKALKKSFRKGGAPELVGEEVELDEKTKIKQLHLFDTEREAIKKAKEIGGQAVQNKRDGKWAAVIFEEVELTEEFKEKDFDALKKGDTITIEFKSSMSTGKSTFRVTAKNIVGKAKVHKATLQNVKNPRSVKFFLYKRGNKVSLAQGDMAASVVKYTVEGVELDEEVFYWYIIKGNTEKGKVAHVGTERELKLKIRKPTFPPNHVLLKSRKDLKIGDNWKGSMGVSEEVEIDEAPSKSVSDYLKFAKTQRGQGPTPVLDVKDVDKWVKEIKKGIKAGWVSAASSTLGGDENVAILIKLTLEPEKDWPHKILQNATYGMIRIATDGTMEMFASDRRVKNMRKTKVKSAKDVVNKINTWIKTVSEEVVIERKMTDGEKEEREEIVKKLKPKLQSFKDRYGDDAEKVMYATATKQAMEEVELEEMPNRRNMEKINSLLKKYSGQFKWRDEVLYVEKGIEKDVTSLIKKGGLTATVKVSSNPLQEKKSATGYELYHKTFSDAMQHAYAHAKSKGFVVDPKEIDDKVATGPKKPSSGKTNRYSLKAGRKTVEIQVANLDNKRYELNMYIEGVELEEALSRKDQLRLALAKSKFKKSGGKVEVQPPSPARYSHKYRGKNVAAPKTKEDEKMAQDVQDYRKKMYNKKMKKEEVEIDEAFSMGKGDKRVVDAFYDQKEIKAHGASILTTDGKTLTKRGMGGQDIAKWVNGKIKIVAVSDVKSTELILKYMKKSIPSGVFEEVVIESTKEYAKSLEKIANDKALKMLTKSERENLKKIADLLAKERKEEIEVDETTNSVGGGNVAGLGVGAQGEPGARPRKKKKKINEAVQMSKFAGKDVFIVDSDTYHACRLGKKQYARYEKYVGKNSIGLAIREYGLKYPKRPIILQNGDSGPMLYLKYGRS